MSKKFRILPTAEERVAYAIAYGPTGLALSMVAKLETEAACEKAFTMESFYQSRSGVKDAIRERLAVLASKTRVDTAALVLAGEGSCKFLRDLLAGARERGCPYSRDVLSRARDLAVSTGAPKTRVAILEAELGR